MAGDFLVQGQEGEQWSVPQNIFLSLYEECPSEGSGEGSGEEETAADPEDVDLSEGEPEAEPLL